MWRMKVTVVTVVMLGALMFGAVVAYAGWGWNAKVDIDGTLISTAWTAKHDHSGPSDVSAEITVVVPREAAVFLVEAAANESIILERSDDLKCTLGGIETTVIYMIEHSSDDDVNGRVKVVVSTVKKHQKLASASGVLGESILVNVVVPGSGCRVQQSP